MSDPDGWMVIRAGDGHLLMSREEALKAAATATNRAALGGRTAVYVVAAVTIEVDPRPSAGPHETLKIDPIYERGYQDGEANREDDIRIAVQYATTPAELIEQLRRVTGDPDLELGSEWAMGDSDDVPAAVTIDKEARVWQN